MRDTLLSAWIALVLAVPAWGAESSTPAPSGGIASFSAGGGVLLPLGNDYVTLGSAPAFQGDLNLAHQALGPDLDIRFTGFYLPFSIENIPGSAATIGVLGVLLGLEYHAPGSYGKLSPYFGVQVGADYEFLRFPGGSNTSQNSGISFAVRVIPGIELPMGSTVSLLVEVPFHAMIGKHTVYLGGFVSSLRFHL